MGWTSYLEDIQKRRDDVATFLQSINNFQAPKTEFSLEQAKAELERIIGVTKDAAQTQLDVFDKLLDAATDPEIHHQLKLEQLTAILKEKEGEVASLNDAKRGLQSTLGLNRQELSKADAKIEEIYEKLQKSESKTKKLESENKSLKQELKEISAAYAISKEFHSEMKQDGVKKLER